MFLIEISNVITVVTAIAIVIITVTVTVTVTRNSIVVDSFSRELILVTVYRANRAPNTLVECFFFSLNLV